MDSLGKVLSIQLATSMFQAIEKNIWENTVDAGTLRVNIFALA